MIDWRLVATSLTLGLVVMFITIWAFGICAKNLYHCLMILNLRCQHLFPVQVIFPLLLFVCQCPSLGHRSPWIWSRKEQTQVSRVRSSCYRSSIRKHLACKRTFQCICSSSYVTNSRGHRDGKAFRASRCASGLGISYCVDSINWRSAVGIQAKDL